MFTSKYNSKTGILETKFYNKVCLTDIIEYAHFIKNYSSHSKLLKIITNLSNTEFDFSVNDLKKINNEAEKPIKTSNCIVNAIIADNPQTTAFSIIYNDLIQSKDYFANIFCSKSETLKWINSY